MARGEGCSAAWQDPRPTWHLQHLPEAASTRARHSPAWARRLAGTPKQPILRGPLGRHSWEGPRESLVTASPGGGTAFRWGRGRPSRRERKASRFPRGHAAFPASPRWELRPHAVLRSHPCATGLPLAHSAVPGPRVCPGAAPRRPLGWPERPHSPAHGHRMEGGTAQALALLGASPSSPAPSRAPHTRPSGSRPGSAYFHVF